MADGPAANEYLIAGDEKRTPEKARLAQNQRDKLVVAEGFRLAVELLEVRRAEGEDAANSTRAAGDVAQLRLT